MSAAFVHATAVVADSASLGKGVKIWHFCHVMAGARIGEDSILGQNGFVAAKVVIGRDCRIQNNVSLYDGVVLGDGVFVGPSAVFTNVRRPRARFPRKDAFEATIVEDGVTIGANATIICGSRLGRGAMVAAGAVVSGDVPAFALVAGVPARSRGWVCLCGESLEPDRADARVLRCAACRRNYRSEEGRVREDDE